MANLKFLSKPSFWLILALVLFILPLSSQADNFISTGLPCSVEEIPDYDDHSGPVNCPICRIEGATSIRLLWGLDKRSYTKPFCWISCRDKKGKGCASGSSWHSKDADSMVSSLNTDTRLEPTDYAYLPDHQLPYVGTNIYQIGCMESANCFDPDGRNNGNCVNTQIYSAPVHVSQDCREPCERSFFEIISAEEREFSSPIPITEKDMTSWFSEVGKEDTWYLEGSGDSDTDLPLEIKAAGCPSSCPLPEYTSNKVTLEKLKNYTDKKLPAQMIISTPRIVGAIQNSVIVTSAVKTGDKYLVEFIDPLDKQQFGEFECTTFSGGDYRCRAQSGRFSEEPFVDYDGFLLGLNRGSKIDSWASALAQSCTSAPWKDKDICLLSHKTRLEMSSFPYWRKKPLFSDMSDSSYSFGWVSFVLRVIYFGDFVGTDYHPNDGNYVGTDCDANHYPITKKTSFFDNPSLWLANIFEPLKNLKLK